MVRIYEVDGNFTDSEDWMSVKYAYIPYMTLLYAAVVGVAPVPHHHHGTPTYYAMPCNAQCCATFSRAIGLAAMEMITRMDVSALAVA